MALYKFYFDWYFWLNNRNTNSSMNASKLYTVGKSYSLCCLNVHWCVYVCVPWRLSSQCFSIASAVSDSWKYCCLKCSQWLQQHEGCLQCCSGVRPAPYHQLFMQLHKWCCVVCTCCGSLSLSHSPGRYRFTDPLTILPGMYSCLWGKSGKKSR